MPSGHAQGAVVFWGYLATQLKRPFWWALAIFMPLIVGIGRVYVGDHFPQDVLVGWTLGIVIVAAMALLQKPVTAWLGKKSLATQVGLGAIVFERGDDAEAIRLWQDAAARNPGLVLARTNLAMAQWRSGDREGARRTLDRVLELSPAFAPAADLLKRFGR